ncbi:hypothetical protein [Micromonospora trifolii]|uniref:hypothetical protein n=1 Tax=Micromonospora trifolii TaxID=2911208 RepID=UPI003CF9E570
MHGVAVLGFLLAVAPITATPGTSLTLVCWLAGWTVVSGAAARLLRTASVRRALDRLTGVLLVGLGVRAATT